MKIAVFVLCIVVVTAVVLLFNKHTYNLPIFSGTGEYREETWMFGEKGQPMAPTRLSDRHMIEPGKVYVLSTELTYSGAEDIYPSAFFKVGNYEIWVYLDDVEMFRYTVEERGYPQLLNMGGAAFSIPLNRDCRGSQLRIELRSSMNYAAERRMPDVIMGDHSVYMRHVFLQNLPGMLISTAIFLVTLVLVFLGNDTAQKRWAYLHFALFAVVIVIYRCSQDLFFMYIWANPLLTVTLEYFSLVFCPFPVLLAFRSELKPHFEKTFMVLIGICAVNISAQLILHFFGIRDVVTMLGMTHGVLLISALVMGIMALQIQKRDHSVRYLQTLLPILVGMVLDFVTYCILEWRVGSGSFYVIGNFIGLGLLTSLSIMVWDTRKEREKAFAEREQARLLKQMAYHDALTGMLNRTAFTRELEEIQSGTRGERGLRAVVADLNDLKRTNDTRGHGAGDALICRAADLLTECFQPYGPVFRTGGDEFVALLYEVSDARWEQLQKTFGQKLQERNQDGGEKLSIALGSVPVEGDIHACIRAADRRMYEDKARIKSGAAS